LRRATGRCHTDIRDMRLTIELEQEVDGRWIAEVPELPGVLVYSDTQEKAAQLARALAFRVLADQIESGELSAAAIETVSFAA
jgi:predicted RNase H-like HicB family nuclease